MLFVKNKNKNCYIIKTDIIDHECFERNATIVQTYNTYLHVCIFIELIFVLGQHTAYSLREI